MWRNYLVVGVRALVKNRTYALINILGLAIGMAACLMILLFVRYEFSYDKWLENSENVYQLQSWYDPSVNTGGNSKLQMSPYPSAAALKKDFPQVERLVYAQPSEPVVMKDGQASTAQNFLYANDDFLAVVPLPMLHGSQNALAQPNSAVVTRSEALRRFGTENAIGRTLTVISRGQMRDFRITGVLRDLPTNSHMRINTIARIDYESWYANGSNNLNCWGCQNGWVWAKLKPGSDAKAMEAQFPAWEKRNIPTEMAGDSRFNAGDEQDWRLIPLHEIHLGQGQGGAMTPGNDSRTILTFAVIALLILGMAVINFTNLATARASQRAREVALRKVLGATRRQLIFQFIAESVLISMIAMLIALAFVELLMPGLARFLEADIPVRYFGAGGILLPVIGLMLTVGVLSGIYPAFFLSRFQPATVLKANKSAAEAGGTGRLRNILVVGQFAVSIGLIVCTIVVYAQTVYARTVDPGYKRDHILQVEELNRYTVFDKAEAIAAQTARLPGVKAVGLTAIGIATRNNNGTNVMVQGNPDPIALGNYPVDIGLKDAMGLELLAGRWFDEREMDDMTLPLNPDLEKERVLVARGANIVVNESAAKRMGFATPAEAVGKTVRAALVDNSLGLVPVTIVGVMKDARFRSVRQTQDALFFYKTRAGQSHMIVRFEGDPAVVRANVERMWKGMVPDVPFNARFSEEVMLELYRAEDSRAKSFAGFAVLAVIVACLGLFGLAAFTAERRTKEIGVRKVLGARTWDIVRLLVWQFSKPVVIANLIAWPVAWWVMRDWLNGFDGRITLGPVPFLIAGVLALCIAVGTIGAHAFRVARANPINALRYE
ncbi:ABC transporter permease [Sphingomonas sp. G-3-2-10]|uniref:ABC transporter permease n=1 Tax=Sphingomonas sp. G-3-2-10 TaxID=2728838 RepID=UPI00146C15ED|nr:ABC transporter permease [Sphingomonas sp. G-3-2-10]NML05360.1 FtsX-like permease family protein [Sphingomonas sp. G-3-2-10]